MIAIPRSTSHISLYQYVSLFILLSASTASQLTAVITVIEPPALPSSLSYLSPAAFRHSVLVRSNAYRRWHNARPLVWNEHLANYAHSWGTKCIWKHSHGPYGENLAYGYPNASAAIDAWGDEAQSYNFDSPTGFTEETGHFTQLVWRSTTDVGCAAVDCGYGPADSHYRPQGWFVVCEYAPPGNVVGRNNAFFQQNVLPATMRKDLLDSQTKHSIEVGTVTSGPTRATSSGGGRRSAASGGRQRLLSCSSFVGWTVFMGCVMWTIDLWY